MTDTDTIAAISTPVGTGGIGIIRLSGPDSIRIAGSVFRKAGSDPGILNCPSHSVHYGHIMREGQIVDEVMAVVMRSPRTYTAEDVVEFNCHGGTMSLKMVLELCLRRGARLADPGEFTKRAFLNGRIDLAQAEAVLDIINSETRAAQKTAIGQLSGKLSRKLRELRHDIINILSVIELTIDFSQEDVEFPELESVVPKIEKTRATLKNILDTAGRGMLLRRGASAVICGRPNVGKSSLMNAVLRHDRVIVTPVAGTTRDVIEEHVDISGVKVRITDTAGIIDTRDRVELEGIKRSRERLAGADIALFVLDASVGLSVRDTEIYRAIKDKKKILVLNKTDLPVVTTAERVSEAFPGEPVVEVSGLKKEGLESLEDGIAEILFGGETVIPEDAVITSLRHKEALDNALECLERAENTTSVHEDSELIASDLREAVQFIGLVTGQTVQDDVLERIFSGFCIGK